MRASYSSRSHHRCKTRTPDPHEIGDATADRLLHRVTSLAPDEKARRAAALRGALRGTAPDFHARARLGREGDPR